MVDTQTFCEVGGMAAFVCDHCRGLSHLSAPALDDEASSERPLRKGVWFGAYNKGKCGGCGETFYGGDLIRADGHGGWEAQECCGGGTSG